LPSDLAGEFVAPSNALDLLTKSRTAAPTKKTREGGAVRDATGEPRALQLEERKLFVRGLPTDVTESELETFFGEFGPVRSVIIIKSKATATAPAAQRGALA
jgi:RNA recognition motif-containing protein